MFRYLNYVPTSSDIYVDWKHCTRSSGWENCVKRMVKDEYIFVSPQLRTVNCSIGWHPFKTNARDVRDNKTPRSPKNTPPRRTRIPRAPGVNGRESQIAERTSAKRQRRRRDELSRSVARSRGSARAGRAASSGDSTAVVGRRARRGRRRRERRYASVRTVARRDGKKRAYAGGRWGAGPRAHTRARKFIIYLYTHDNILSHRQRSAHTYVTRTYAATYGRDRASHVRVRVGQWSVCVRCARVCVLDGRWLEANTRTRAHTQAHADRIYSRGPPSPRRDRRQMIAHFHLQQRGTNRRVRRRPSHPLAAQPPVRIDATTFFPPLPTSCYSNSSYFSSSSSSSSSSRIALSRTHCCYHQCSRSIFFRSPPPRVRFSRTAPSSPARPTVV